MKRLGILGILLFFYLSGAAQGFFIGGKYAVSSTWLLNKEERRNLVPSFGDTFGLMAGFNLSRGFGIETNILFNSHLQKYRLESLASTSRTQVEIKSIDIPVLLKIGHSIYFEGGPLFSFTRKAEWAELIDSNPSGIEDITESLLDKYTGICLGSGLHFRLFQSWIIDFGLRLNIGINDIGGVNSAGELWRNISNDISTYPLSGFTQFGIAYEF